MKKLNGDKDAVGQEKRAKSGKDVIDQEKKAEGEQNAISQESKSEIGELLDELFVRELKEEMNAVSSRSESDAGALAAFKKQSDTNHVEICDKMDEMEQRLDCLGTNDEWEDETVKTFLNQIADQINSDTALVKDRIDQSEQAVIKPELEKIRLEISRLGDPGKAADDIKIQIAKMETSVGETLRAVSDAQNTDRLKLQSLEEKLDRNYDLMNGRMNELDTAWRKRFFFLACGAGLASAVNIVMLIIILMK